MLVVQVEMSGQARVVSCTTDLDGLDVGDRLLVEVSGRTSFGRVIRVPLDLEWSRGAPAGKVVRRASRADEERQSHMDVRREEWLEIAHQQVLEHDLPMRILRADLTPSLKKVTFHFVAEGRVDFRGLVRDLARLLRTRVELRQIGVRDATALQGGIGHCGESLCCARFLNGFAPVSMRMAKAQGLPLNPSKISGQCGRLMCCLRYELDEPDQKRRPPSKGSSGGGGNRGSKGSRGDRGRSSRPPQPGRAPSGKGCASGGCCRRQRSDGSSPTPSGNPKKDG